MQVVSAWHAKICTDPDVLHMPGSPPLLTPFSQTPQQIRIDLDPLVKLPRTKFPLSACVKTESLRPVGDPSLRVGELDTRGIQRVLRGFHNPPKSIRNCVGGHPHEPPHADVTDKCEICILRVSDPAQFPDRKMPARTCLGPRALARSENFNVIQGPFMLCFVPIV